MTACNNRRFAASFLQLVILMSSVTTALEATNSVTSETPLTGPELTTEAPPTDPASQQQIFTATTQAVIYFIIGGLGLTGNLFVLVVIFLNKEMRESVTNMFITNQSIVDAVTGVILILGVVFGDNGQTMYGNLGEFLCKVWYSKSLLWSALNASTYNLLALTLERYLAVIYPIKYKLWVSRRTALVVCIMSWVVGTAIQIMITMMPSGLHEGRCNYLIYWPSKSFQRGVGIFTIVMKFVLPLLIMCFCYIRIAVVLNARVRPGANTRAAGSVQGDAQTTQTKSDSKMEKAKRNTVKTLVSVTCCYAFCWVWNQLMFLYFNSGNSVDFTSWLYHVGVILVFCNCCCNPFIYVAQYQQFKTGVKRLRFKLMGKKDEEITY